MHDLTIIIKREYYSRVRRKSFLLMTILTPFFIILSMAIPSFLVDDALGGKESVLVFGDIGGRYTQALQRNSDFLFVEATGEYLETTNPEKAFSALLYLPKELDETPNLAFFVSNSELPPALKHHLDGRLSEAATLEKIRKNAPDFANAWRENQVEVHCQKMEEIQSASHSDETAALTSIVVSFLLYLFIFSYGSQVMRGVTEEKSNKIMEVMFLSTRPTHFIAGKIIGIALVGLTQFVLWAGAGWVICQHYIHESGISPMLQTISWSDAISPTALGCYFILFFLAGYLLYASLFATIGALSDPSTDTQQFFLPVTVPIIFSIYAGIYTACHPESQLAVWCSYIPFTSPVVMMARICHGIAFWKVGISLLLLVLTDICLFSLSGRVYRSAILLHGKRVGYKDLWRLCKG